MIGARLQSVCSEDKTGMGSVWRDCCSPPVWPPPPLIEAPRRHQGRAVWINPVVFRAITISWNNIIIPRSWPYHRHPDNNPPWFMNDLCLPRPGFSTRRPEVTQRQGRSESARDGHYFHASASLPESAKGLKARQANSLSTGVNDQCTLFPSSKWSARVALPRWVTRCGYSLPYARKPNAGGSRRPMNVPIRDRGAHST